MSSRRTGGAWRCRYYYALLLHLTPPLRQALAYVAAKRGHVCILRLLADLKGVDLHRAAYDGTTPTFAAAEEGRPDCLRYLLANGALVEQEDRPDGWTLALAAAQGGHLECLRFLVDEGIDVNQVTAIGFLVRVAAENNHFHIIRFLASKGANMEQVDEAGDTTLTWAAYHGCFDIFRLFASLGCNLFHCDKGGVPALEQAEMYGHTDIALLLYSVDLAGGWREYVAARRFAYVRIRHKVSSTYALVPKGSAKLIALYHFLFGKTWVPGGAGDGQEPPNKLVKAGAPTLTVPSAVFRYILGYLDP